MFVHVIRGSAKNATGLRDIERLIRRGNYTGPLVLNWVGIGGGADGPNPYNLMEFVRRVPPGAVLTIESIMRNVLPLQGGYAISKGALNTAMQVLARELGQYKIRVNSVVPGWMNFTVSLRFTLNDVKLKIAPLLAVITVRLP